MEMLSNKQQLDPKHDNEWRFTVPKDVWDFMKKCYQVNKRATIEDQNCAVQDYPNQRSIAMVGKIELYCMNMEAVEIRMAWAEYATLPGDPIYLQLDNVLWDFHLEQWAFFLARAEEELVSLKHSPKVIEGITEYVRKCRTIVEAMQKH